ncbi:TIGR02206 family membrane protein [Cytobacillus firmus]|uniref:YwaF family protein n=1 Tax=Cytobacillus firmus TaxID=1399 RepID=UPI0018CE74B3|nr:TIGR02206 family membrane protein [Cytobacillus firmus]MBG9443875.1 membrane protein [Cytobacillus firmus]MBY6052656.1 TIGR02206 family membrane protein [Cytobacillus firmus]USK40912.1 TIGR02206 family membrane protein [Cytobacillus firmus]
MSHFFSHNYQAFPFSTFTLSHIAMIALFAGVAVFLYKFRKTIKRYDRKLRMTMFLLLFVLELLYHFWLYLGGYWEISFTLPLQLCSISLLLCLVLLATESKAVFQIVYYIGVTGALMAILTPELFLGFPHFRFFQFFITHNLIIWTCLYFVFVRQFRPTGRGLIESFIFLNLCAAAAFFANKLTGGNYMFLARKPQNNSLLDYFGPYPYYIITLEIAALLLFLLLLLPFKMIGENKDGKAESA